MNLQQQQMAQELQQTFQADREQRSQTMQSLYRHFANSRLERQQDLLNLQTEMWRNVKAYRANLFNQVWGDIHAPTIAVPKTSKKSARSSPNLVEQAIVSPQAIASPPPSPAAQTQAVPQKQPPSSSQSRSAIMQKAVYDYIKQVKTARLKDIEETLNINRVQTVDILKSLMAKGLVTQNNRDYIVVETN
jgi:phosphopantothenoylcysteine synthetase/decarboxylase